MALTSSPSSSTPPSSTMNYHVFLSFRGEDTRTNFTDHLYSALLRKGIVTFRDDEELPRGEVISEKLIKAIEQSLFSVVILSQHYASSSWCLDELEKILESKQDLGQTVFPVFYGVDPSDIRRQKGSFATAFDKHEGVFSNDKVRRWREALTTVANLCGWDIRNRDIFLPTNFCDTLLRDGSKEHLYMHDLLQEMGRSIVLQESPGDASQRSRLWSLEDIDLVLKGDRGTENIRSIYLDIQQEFEAKWHPDCFSKMQNIQLLNLSNVHLLHNLNSLPSALKFLTWDHYALESLPSFDQLYELECLQLCNSKIRKLWNGPASLGKLRIIDLSDSDCLIETPDFSATPNLEELVLTHCSNLVGIHKSVGQLKKLVKLRLDYCIHLVTLPSYLETNNLEEFILGGCINLEKLPEFGRDMTSLYFLDVRSTRIKKIPLSTINLINLKYLDVSDCNMLNSKVPELPPNLIICGSYCPLFNLSRVLQNLYDSHVFKGPIHVFFDYMSYAFLLKSGVPFWFEQQEHRRSKSNSGEVVTIKAHIPHENAYYKGECWEIVICVVFTNRSDGEAWRGFSINWKFQDFCHPNDNVITNEERESFLWSGCRAYLGVYPIDKEHCRQHPTGVGSQVDLTLYFPTPNITACNKTRYPYSEVIQCWWTLRCKTDFKARSFWSKVKLNMHGCLHI